MVEAGSQALEAVVGPFLEGALMEVSVHVCVGGGMGWSGFM